MIIITIVITIKIRATFMHVLFLFLLEESVFPGWDRIYWIKEGLSNYGDWCGACTGRTCV